MGRLLMITAREEQIQKALFRGATLRLENPPYFRSVRNLLKELLASDLGAGDLSAQCLQLEADQAGATAAVIAKSPGVAAGLCEFAWLYGRGGMTVQLRKKD